MAILQNVSATNILLNYNWDLPEWDTIVNTPPPPFLIDKLIPENTIGTLIGNGGTYKSIIALQMSICIATGTSFLGHKSKKGKIVYINYEDSEYVTYDRLKHLVINSNLQVNWKDIQENLKMIFPHSLDEKELMPSTEIGKEFLIKTIKENVSDFQLLIVDTLRQHNENGKENGVEDIVPMLKSLYPFTRLGSVLILHHENKAGGYAGTTAIQTNTRFMLHINEKTGKGNYSIKIEKSNYAEKNYELPFNVSFDDNKKFVLSNEINIVEIMDVIVSHFKDNNGFIDTVSLQSELRLENISNDSWKRKWAEMKKDFFRAYGVEIKLKPKAQISNWNGETLKGNGNVNYITKEDYELIKSKKDKSSCRDFLKDKIEYGKFNDIE